jgi:hypothetical protein
VPLPLHGIILDMTYRGTVRKGVVVLDPGAALDDGTVVEVHPVEAKPAQQTPASQPTIWEKLAAMSGSVKDLPPDAARNLDHYLYGLPKREE